LTFATFIGCSSPEDSESTTSSDARRHHGDSGTIDIDSGVRTLDAGVGNPKPDGSAPDATASDATGPAQPDAGGATGGNNVTDPGEACDGTDLNGNTYATVAAGFVGGTLKCSSDRTAYDVSGLSAGPTVNLPLANCTQAGMQSAIDNATDGTTLQLPAGTCTLSSAININKNIVLRGAGTTSTTLVDGTGGVMIETGSKPVRITGLTITGSASSSAYFIYMGAHNFRMDHLKFTNLGGRRMWVSSEGLIDNNTFVDTADEFIDVEPNNPGIWWNSNGTRGASLQATLGTGKALYVEDHAFQYPTTIQNNALDSTDGAKWVFRYNTVTGVSVQPLEEHGDCSTDSGTFSFEIYGNTITSSQTNWNVISLRGGGGVVFNNTLNGFTDDIILWDYRYFNNHNGSYYGLCGGVLNSDHLPRTLAVDGCLKVEPDNPATWEMSDRPCMEQLHGLYIWDNTAAGKTAPSVRVRDEYSAGTTLMSSYIRLNRDYFLRAPALDSDGFTYTPYPYPHPLARVGAP
jgi:hypothetical protein